MSYCIYIHIIPRPYTQARHEPGGIGGGIVNRTTGRVEISSDLSDAIIYLKEKNEKRAYVYTRACLLARLCLLLACSD